MEQAVGDRRGNPDSRVCAPLVVIGAPLAIDANLFKPASDNLEAKLRLICQRVHAYGDIPVRARTVQSK